MSLKPLYRFKRWEQLFERASLRKATVHTYVALPNGTHADEFERALSWLVARQDGVELLGYLTLMLRQASRCQRRGLLADEAGPLGPEDLEVLCRAPAQGFRRCIEALQHPRIGLLEALDPQTREPLTEDLPLLTAVGTPLPPHDRSNGNGVAGPPVVSEAKHNGTERSGAERSGAPNEHEGEESARAERITKQGENSLAKALKNPSCSSSLLKSDGGLSRPVNRTTGYQWWMLTVSSLWAKGGSQHASDRTDTINLFHEIVWPESLDREQGAARLSRCSTLVARARPKDRPMAYFKTEVNRVLETASTP